ncbi:bifunctional ADP-dependent NAD(P)H-hydrate dehydratase/NAD(P)H-hydrate epimerase [Streptomyces sp. NBC_00249]|uniref:bifunctional ADP-dependent NAD(P)H-hydrate dehydratase/NAD(P)H-hydrate epimerase n=1 Tax=Streptomyces sp. NBC_00249 TaxID=2975690 RepID=UPI0022516F28|nr:bifunctional ADP-dependent NAD(P)H-hydrate dehydratase/NAD(P)H-hydrate epimerase [Streptomyces sp. NBC_00249]MCX5194955.1 bifunctional ADP-dependent NAD(P)H-hydrate dehydratase/NAD(P)H-hydrate epimerase [Streptomyces sp. NBC_00249]
MRTAYSVETVRAAERELMARLPQGALMARAAAGLAAVCAGLLGRVYGSRVVLLVGPGDNGGDALYAGARLARRGAGVTAVPLDPERVHPGGLATLRAAGGRLADSVPARADLVLDGLVGIGGRGGLRPAAAALAGRIPAGAVVVAVDLPSGVDADTGEVAGPAVSADVTVTFGAYKPGLLIDPGASRVGAVRLVGIGLELPSSPDAEALQHADVAALLPAPTASSDKYRRGVVGIVAGSEQYPGAAVLAVAGALRGGAGAVRYVGPAADAVLAHYPEVLVGRGRVQAWVVGPGLGAGRAAEVAGALADRDVPVLVDADGLRGLDPEVVRGRRAATLLTPHAGEAAALLGVPREAVEAGRLAAVRELAGRYGAAVLLKGSTTLVSGGGAGSAGPVRVNPTGTPWLATAGSGDVLSGLAGSLLAAGLGGADAGAVAAYLHGLAGRRGAGGAPVLAHEVAGALPGAWRDVAGV